MVSKKFFIFIFIISAGVSLWLGGDFFYHLNRYFKLTHSKPARVFDWKVVERKEGKFSIESTYQFELEERTIVGKFLFSKPVYPNPYLAEDLVEEWQEKAWTIWYNPKHPHEASLQKMFPMKKGVYLGVSLCVILYFAFLYLYVRRMHVSEEGSGETPSLSP